MTSKAQVPEGWRQVRLGDVVEVNRDLWNPAGGSQIMYLDLTAVIAPGVLSAPKEIAASDAPSRARRQVHSGDILVSTVRPNLRGFARVRKASENLVASTGFAVLTPKTDVDGSFVYHHVMTQPFAVELENATTGQAYPAVRPVDVASYKLPLPPLPEQRSIAAVLDSIDDVIERTDAVIAATEQIRDSLLHELLTRGVPGWHSEWKDVPGLGTIPVAWEVVKLGDVVEILDSRRIPLNADARANMTRVYPYYGANGIVDYVDHWIFNEKQDLILLAEDGGHFDEFVTRPIAYRVRGKCWVNNHAHVLKSKDVGTSGFIFHSIVNKDIRPFINGTTRSKLTQADLKEVSFGFPPMSEQLAINGVLDEADVTLEHVRRERGQLQALKDSTADAFLTGRVRVVHKPPNVID